MLQWPPFLHVPWRRHQVGSPFTKIFKNSRWFLIQLLFYMLHCFFIKRTGTVFCSLAEEPSAVLSTVETVWIFSICFQPLNTVQLVWQVYTGIKISGLSQMFPLRLYSLFSYSFFPQELKSRDHENSTEYCTKCPLRTWSTHTCIQISTYI